MANNCNCNPLLVKLGRHSHDCNIGYIKNDIYVNAICDCNCRSLLRNMLHTRHFTIDDVCDIMGMTPEETNVIKNGIPEANNGTFDEKTWLKFCRPISVLPPKYAYLEKIQELLNCKCCDEHQKRRMWFF